MMQGFKRMDVRMRFVFVCSLSYIEYLLITDFNAFKENIKRFIQHFFQSAGGTGTIDHGRYATDEQPSGKKRIHVAKDSFADAFIDQRADKVLVGVPFFLHLFLTFGF